VHKLDSVARAAQTHKEHGALRDAVGVDPAHLHNVARLHAQHVARQAVRAHDTVDALHLEDVGPRLAAHARQQGGVAGVHKHGRLHHEVQGGVAPAAAGRAVLALGDVVALLDCDVCARVDVDKVELLQLHGCLPEHVEDDAEAVEEGVSGVVEIPAKKWGDTEIAERGRSVLVMHARYRSAGLIPHQRGWMDAG